MIGIQNAQSNEANETRRGVMNESKTCAQNTETLKAKKERIITRALSLL